MAHTPADNTLAEEIAHVITHGAGVVLGVIGLVVMLSAALAVESTTAWVSSAVFCATAVLLYLASTVYHSIPTLRLPALKQRWRKFDHAAIYLLIAGTYTPFASISLNGWIGTSLLVFVWSVAVFGVVWKLMATNPSERISLGLYLAMGWVGILATKPMLSALPAGGLWLLLGGGLAYTGGAVFYAWNRLPFNHAIWHLFVLAGTALHYFSILLYVIPQAGSIS